MSNSLSAVIPQLLAEGLTALRQMAIMPLLVNRRYEAIAGRKGSTIDVPIPSAVSAVDVAPAITPPANADSAPTTVSIALDQWKEAAFYLTDKEELEVTEGHIPAQASEALKALANAVDAHILSKYTKFYGFHGVESGGAHLTPFTDAAGDPTNADCVAKIRTILNKQLAPMDDRYIVLNPDAEGAALMIRAFQDASWSNNAAAIVEGKLQRKLGFAFFMDQNIPRHVAGTAAAESDLVTAGSGAFIALGAKTIKITETSGTHTLVAGDILTIAGHSQTYVVTAGVTLGTATEVSIEPGLQVAISGGENVDVKPSHTVNLAFHRDAIAFATRPLAAHGAELGVISQSAVDPISGLTLRLEVTHQHKQRRFSFDILWGCEVVRREFGARLAGA